MQTLLATAAYKKCWYSYVGSHCKSMSSSSRCDDMPCLSSERGCSSSYRIKDPWLAQLVCCPGCQVHRCHPIRCEGADIDHKACSYLLERLDFVIRMCLQYTVVSSSSCYSCRPFCTPPASCCLHAEFSNERLTIAGLAPIASRVFAMKSCMHQS